MAKETSPQIELERPGSIPFLTRRRLLLGSLGGIGLLGTGLGGRMLLQWRDRHHRARALMQAADGVLGSSNPVQLASLPKQAAGDINRVFAGVCLNVHRFTDEVCSSAFARKLGDCQTDEQRHRLLETTFSTTLVSAVGMQKAVAYVIDKTANQVYRDWRAAVSAIEQAWGRSGISFQDASMSSGLQQRLDNYIAIAQEIRRIQATTYPLAERPTLSETGLAITHAALHLLPVARFGLKVYLPLFIMAGLAHLWDFILGQLAHSELGYREAMSRQLSLLSHQIAAQCEQAFREQIALLHQWQRTAVERLSHQIASDEIPLVL